MFKFFKHGLNKLQFIALCSLVLLCYNIPLFWIKLKTNDFHLEYSVSEVALPAVIFLSFALFSFNSILLKIWSSVLIAISSLILYCATIYGIKFSITLIEDLASTDTKELMELTNVSLVLWVVFLVAMPIYVIFKTKIVRNIKINSYLWSLVAALVCVGIVYHVYPKDVTEKVALFALVIFVIWMGYFAINPKYKVHWSLGAVIIALHIMPYANYQIAEKNKPQLLKEYRGLLYYLPFNGVYNAVLYQNKISKTPTVHQNITQKYAFTMPDKANNPALVVLVIGESARSDRFGLNNYHRNTTPKLSKIQNLITFPFVTALATNTRNAVPLILKREKNTNETSVISVFKSFGYQTYWLSSQSDSSASIAHMTKECTKSISAPSLGIYGALYDGHLLDLLAQYLNEQEVDKQKHNLIVIHTQGSHKDYEKRVPQAFKIYQPLCANEFTCDKQSLDNSYDNTIVYTDHILAKIIDQIKDKNALLIYISDHGESLGENGIYAHSYPIDQAPKEQLHIPMLVWASDRFLSDKANKQKFTQIQSNKNISIDQPFVFHSMLDCASIESGAILKEKSICRNLK